MNKTKGLDFIKRYTMILVLIVVTAFFAWRTGGAILLPMNVSSLISQNAYVFILATGMLLCILTGGNIDLSVGSVVCFVGAIGAVLMVNMKMNMWLAILIMFVIGTLIGAFQGFWIAYVRIPPFIVTLAGMLAFRGLSNVVLQGMTVSIKDCTTFVNLFGGGADCYIPDFFGNGPINLTCVFAGVLAAVIFAVLQLKNRADKVKKGYEAPSLGATIGKIAVIAVVILTFSYRLAQHKGIPSVLIWVLIVIMVYGYITSNTTVGRYFYAVGGNEKATKLSGINTNKVYFLAYMNMGFLAALAGMVKHMGPLDYLLPMRMSEDLKAVEIEEWTGFVEQIAEQSIYEVLILDIDEGIRGVYELLRMCTEIHVAVIKEEVAQAKLFQFEEELHLMGYDDVKQKMVKKELEG